MEVRKWLELGETRREQEAVDLGVVKAEKVSSCIKIEERKRAVLGVKTLCEL